MYRKEFENYPKALLKGRVNVEGAVIGCLLKDMLLLDDTNLNKTFFASKDGLFYFAIIEKLRQKNIATLTEIDILSNFNEKMVDKFDELGGMKQIKLMMDSVEPNNFDVYLGELYKYNAFTKLYDLGFPLEKEIEFNGKNIIPIKEFEKFEVEQVLDFYESMINSLSFMSLEKGIEEEELDITDEYINGCLQGEEMGVPIDKSGVDINGKDIYAFPYLSQQMQGLMPSTLSFLGGYSSVGKSTMLINIIQALVYRGEKVLIISNEQKAKPFKTNFLMWVLVHKLRYYKVTKKKLLAGDVTEEDLAKIKEAQKIWKEEYKGKVYFVSLPNANMKTVKKKIREYHLLKGVTTYLYDTFKLDFSGGNEDNHWVSLIKDSRDLHELAGKYNLIGIATMQLAMNSLGTLFLTPNVLSSSKQVVEILENLLLMRNVYPEELDSEDKRFYCNPYKYKRGEDGKWHEEKVEIDRNKQYRMMFISKCRNGENSQSGNYAMLLQFDGSHGSVSEYCLCRPKNAYLGR